MLQVRWPTNLSSATKVCLRTLSLHHSLQEMRAWECSPAIAPTKHAYLTKRQATTAVGQQHAKVPQIAANNYSTDSMEHKPRPPQKTRRRRACCKVRASTTHPNCNSRRSLSIPVTVLSSISLGSDAERATPQFFAACEDRAHSAWQVRCRGEARRQRGVVVDEKMRMNVRCAPVHIQRVRPPHHGHGSRTEPSLNPARS
jgi:hypothetical protein